MICLEEIIAWSRGSVSYAYILKILKANLGGEGFQLGAE